MQGSLQLDYLAFLRLAQLADSALPIGSTAHSFGLESLVAEGYLTVETLEAFLQESLLEAGLLESCFCRQSHHLSDHEQSANFSTQWVVLNDRMSALKTARESRTASATLGRRFLQLVRTLEDDPLLAMAQQAAKEQRAELHYSIVFGLVGGILGVDAATTVLAFLHQSLLAQVSACQRLLPLGQSQASAILWRLKPVLLEVSERSEQYAEKSVVFTPLIDTASMRHPQLTTRLFIS
ncbi:urease accessory protein UreF [Tengunoibacter tsumagoiensis]|uniref:Urease accessory protein UreF n=1 Tax=Tengunoibacter tsumagoiensis TaxID=2014871 RepID=A0A402A3J2_9CHLR|nr:urease accessory UreF family protein [Tengunoibacter tsumagoiensis]GCE13605.1 urease accessory protein UreF [Tengunoibacter tsumagoiensis]